MQRNIQKEKYWKLSDKKFLKSLNTIANKGIESVNTILLPRDIP